MFCPNDVESMMIMKGIGIQLNILYQNGNSESKVRTTTVDTFDNHDQDSSICDTALIYLYLSEGLYVLIVVHRQGQNQECFHS